MPDAVVLDTFRVQRSPMHVGVVASDAKYATRSVYPFVAHLKRHAPSAQVHVLLISGRLAAEGLVDHVHYFDSVNRTVAAALEAFANRSSGAGRLLNYKLMIPFLPTLTVRRFCFVDNDLYFHRPVADLWSRFDEFTGGQAIGVARNHDGVPGFNTGVMLLALDKLRRNAYLDALRRAARAGGRLGWLSDQVILTRVLTQHAGMLHELPCGWNRQLSTHFAHAAWFNETWGACRECFATHFSSVHMKAHHRRMLADGCDPAPPASIRDRHQRQMMSYVHARCCGAPRA